MEHPDVQDAAVIGVIMYAKIVVPPARMAANVIGRNGEELPRAYITRQAGSKASEKEIASYLAARVAPHKRLAGGVMFVPDIPKNPSGKILRKALRDQAKAEVGDGDPKESKL